MGLDSGEPIPDDAGVESVDGLPGDAAAVSDAAAVDAATLDTDPTDAGDAPDAPPVCPPGKADCNGIAKDGCETNLNDPMHCGSCTNACLPTFACKAESCCLNPHAPCTTDSECCSGKCDEDKGCH